MELTSSDIIQQQKNRIVELELALNELGNAAFNVAKYFGDKTMKLEDIKTSELIEELKKREGVIES